MKLVPEAFVPDQIVVPSPLQKCRGLIETRRYRGFRGRARHLPRRKRWGLIEAMFRNAPRVLHLPSFSSRNAGASLKLPSCPAHPGHLAYLPRRKCRGLIEADTAPQHPCRPGCLPRQKCRGLIEARICHRPTCRQSWHLPRQKCLGLIEARCARRPAPSRSAIFPGGNAGASLKQPGTGGTRHKSSRSSPAEMPGPH